MDFPDNTDHIALQTLSTKCKFDHSVDSAIVSKCMFRGQNGSLQKKSEECAMQRSAGACTQIVRGTPKVMVSCRGGGGVWELSPNNFGIRGLLVVHSNVSFGSFYPNT